MIDYNLSILDDPPIIYCNLSLTDYNLLILCYNVSTLHGNLALPDDIPPMLHEHLSNFKYKL